MLSSPVPQDLDQAERFARSNCRKHNDKEKRKQLKGSKYRPQFVNAVIFTYKVDVNKLKGLNPYIFEEEDDNWKHFVYNNRIDNTKYLPCHSGVNQQIPPQYDYVSGPLADGSMADLEFVKSGDMRIEEFLDTVVSIGHQISFNSVAAVKSLIPFGVKSL